MATTATDEPTQFILADYTNPPQLLADVTADLDSLGIRYETIAEESALVPVGFVHRTDPVAGTLILADQTVQVYFNPDPQLVPVPGVVGLTLEDARLRARRRRVSRSARSRSRRPTRSPRTPSSAPIPRPTPRRCRVRPSTIVVAGPPDSVQVPGQVVGMTRDRRAGAARGAAVRRSSVTTAVQSSSTIPEGTVIEINPGPGALVEIGSAVTIVVSTGPQPVTVPSVIGQTEGRARNTLTERWPRRPRHVPGGPRRQPRRRTCHRPEPPGGFARRPRHRDHDHRRPVGAGGDHAPADAHHDGPAHDGPAHHRSHHRGADHPGPRPRFLRPRSSDPYCRPGLTDDLGVAIEVGRAPASSRGLPRRRQAARARKLRSEVMAVRGEDALGMELHALDLVLAVADAHHDAVGRAGGDDSASGIVGGSSVSE